MPLPPFRDLTLITTERCNLRCAFCYVPKRGREMPEDLALRGVDLLLDGAPRGVRPSVGFFGGEPLLSRDLLARVVAHGRRRRADLRFTMPTNGRLVDQEIADELQRAGMELALSVDDAAAAGDDQHTLEGIAPNLPHLKTFAPIVRLTVTPDNVAHLTETVVAVFEAGFRRIMHQPALERPWPDAAVETWAAQHRQLADWAAERYEQRRPLPDLTVLEGIITRLGGRGAAYCGAGVRTAALDPTGRLFGCYRSAYDPRADRLVLADLNSGWINEPLVAAYARLHPHRARPERGPCRSCPARDGCNVYCPAMGHVLLGDLRGVPADACRLTMIQVEICRDLLRRTRRADRRRGLRVGARVAAAALALGLAGGSAACDDGRPVTPDATVDSVPPGLCDASPGILDGWPGGVCPVPVPDVGPAGLCDAAPAPDLYPPPWPDLAPPDAMAPGQCPAPVDGGPMPGLCPVVPPDGGWTPGLC